MSGAPSINPLINLMDSKIKTTLLECITTGMNSPHRCIECWNEANKKLIWNDGNEVIFVQLCILAAERARNNPKEMKGVSLQIREHGNILDLVNLCVLPEVVLSEFNFLHDDDQREALAASILLGTHW